MQLAVEVEKTFGKLTDEQFFQFCLANKGRLRIERDENGQIILMPPTGLEASSGNADLTTEFTLWNRKQKPGLVFDSNGGFTLPDTSVKAADVAWISHEKWEALAKDERKRFAKAVPDFVLELRSASDELVELKKKMEKWMENGVRLGWLVDTQNRTTHIYRPGQEPEKLDFTEKLLGEDVLPGFEINLSELFQY